jgi:hypothetical protein
MASAQASLHAGRNLMLVYFRGRAQYEVVAVP